MKKIVKLFITILLCVCLTALTACDTSILKEGIDNLLGRKEEVSEANEVEYTTLEQVFVGNYKREVNGAKINVMSRGIKKEKLFGDKEDDNWSLGYKVSENLTASLYFDETNKADLNFKLTQNLGFQKEETTNKITIKSDSEIDSKLTSTGDILSKIGSHEILGKAYIDGGVYYDGKIVVNKTNDVGLIKNIVNLEGKVNFIEVIEDLMAENNVTWQDISNFLNKGSKEGCLTSDEILALKDFIKKYNVKMYVDMSNGIKTKLSFNNQSFLTALKQLQDKGELKGLNVTPKIKYFDVYISIDKNGLLDGIKIYTDAYYGIETPYGNSVRSLSLTLKGDITIIKDDIKVNLPKEYENYENIVNYLNNN